ncbi:T9SS type A sorting domain-containing protein [Aquimarina sp. MMG016]|uniref:T9SS type A sorting domain-containing protein n=1 Tax=Aquimarina sp. MMG016 TaxID=2822690 RepID=UPI001B3A4936|nr:T9SS type A sorting domain-containing protein [Aquimarina sp. MMG016]MBQ4819867.1 T9SS type A sorting domain-containing protein [Aquimarina sp. MMG016]
MKRIYFSIFFFTVLVQKSNAQIPPYGTPGEQTIVEKSINNNLSYGFLEYLPENFDDTSGQKYPLVIFLHGIGENGDGSAMALQNELLGSNNTRAQDPPSTINSQNKDYEAIILSPQSGSGWWASNAADQVKQIYDFAIANYPVNLDRVYITGLSAGGTGTLRFAEKYPELIAGIVTIAPANPLVDYSEPLSKLPAWLFVRHEALTNNTIKTADILAKLTGTNSSVWDYHPRPYYVANRDITMQLVENTRWDTQEGVFAPNTRVAATFYGKQGHAGWAETYMNDEMWSWLFTQNRQNNVLSVPNNQLLEISISIFPNPAKENLSIKTDKDNIKLSLYDNTGKQLLSIQEGNYINLSFLQKGVYVLRIEDKMGEVLNKKIIKQ